MTPRQASLALDRLTLYVSSDAFEGSLHYVKMRAAGLTEPKDYFPLFVGRISDYFRSLPPDRFPHITANVDALIADDGEARFTYGLDLLIAGLAAQLL